MTITLNLDPTVEARLVDQACQRGISLEQLLSEIVSNVRRESGSNPQSGKPRLKLASLHLGDVGSLRRCEIYDDAD